MRNSKTVDTVIRTEARSDGAASYVYRLVMKESSQLASYRIPLYSINLEMTSEDGTTTSAQINDAFADAGRAILFFEKLVRNLATPVDLPYILEDDMK